MSGEIRLQATADLTVKALIVGDGGTVWNGTAMVAVSTLSDANWTASLIACTEQDTSGSAGTGLYVADWPGGLTQAARYSVVFFSGAAPAPGDLEIGIQHDPTEYVASDVYHADIDLAIDETNTQDEYTVSWFNNGARVTSGITVPKIQVVKRVDGTDLIAVDTMTEIGSIGSYKYDESTNRITAGEAVVVLVTATIGGSSREFARVWSRDSSA